MIFKKMKLRRKAEKYFAVAPPSSQQPGLFRESPPPRTLHEEAGECPQTPGPERRRSWFRTAWLRSLMPDRHYEQLSTSDEPLDDDRSPKSRSDRNTPLARYLLLALTFVVVAFCSYKAGQWSVKDPQHAGDINTGTTKPKPDNSSTDTPTMPGNGKYSVG